MAGVPGGGLLLEWLLGWCVVGWLRTVGSRPMHVCDREEFELGDGDNLTFSDPVANALLKLFDLGVVDVRAHRGLHTFSDFLGVRLAWTSEEKILPCPVDAKRISFTLVPPRLDHRPLALRRILVVWRELAAIYPDGPQPPASVEEAFEIYGPKAEALPS